MASEEKKAETALLTIDALAAKVAELTVQIATQNKNFEGQNELLEKENGLLKEQNENLSKAFSEIKLQEGFIEAQNSKIEELKDLIASGRATAAGAQLKAVPATVPVDPIKHAKKKYLWKVAAFSLPGDPTRYTAEEASVTPELLDKILSIPGQKILQEQL